MKPNCRAFSLVELMVVVAIMAMMMSLALPSLWTISQRGRFNKALSAVAAELELAQQAAVAGSTYTWVAFAKDANQPTVMLSARSLEGSSPSSLSIDLTTGGTTATATYLGGIQTLENVQLANALPAGLTYTQLPDGFATANPGTPDQTKLVFKGRPPGAAAVRNFNWVVEFNPMGEASIRSATGTSVPMEAIQLVLIPCAGSSPTTAEQKQTGFLWISGHSGKVDIYQP